MHSVTDKKIRCVLFLKGIGGRQAQFPDVDVAPPTCTRAITRKEFFEELQQIRRQAANEQRRHLQAHFQGLP